MIRIARFAAVLPILAAVILCGGLIMGAIATPPAIPDSGDRLDAEADSGPSVTCIPLGLYGDITTPLLVGRLSDSGDNLTFVGTANGLYVVAPGGRLDHFLYSPFGIKHIALIDDITGDGIREVVIALSDTQVPALRCYDGATWERLWQFAPSSRVWHNLWIERQLAITNLEVVNVRGSQSIVVTSGRSLFSVDAKDGRGQRILSASSALRRMVSLADLNGNGDDEVFVGSDDGHVYLLSGKSGNVRWRTRLPERDGVDHEGASRLVSDIAVLDKELGLVVVASADGWLRMYNLTKRTREWQTTILDEDTTEGYSTSESILLSLTPDLTGDGLPEILLIENPSGSYAYSQGVAKLCDSAGNLLWRRDTIGYSALGVETGSFEDNPVFLQRGSREIKLVDLRDGVSVLHTIPLDVFDSAGVFVSQPGGDGYMSFPSDGDLAAISAGGELLWHYPRLTSVTAKSGAFVGDQTPDSLFCGEWSSGSENGYAQSATRSGGGMIVGGSSEEAPAVRVLQMMDGDTQNMVWSYELPFELFKNGGLKGMRVTADMVGDDNVQDIVGFREDTVFIFSGRDGGHRTFQAGQTIVSLDIVPNGALGNAIFAAVDGGLMIFDVSGNQIWTTTSEEWSEDGSGSFMVLNDINSDNMSDLAIISASRILVLKSTAATSRYVLHQTFNTETDSLIEYAEVVPDADGDGVRDLAYVQREQVRPQKGQYTPPRLPLLVGRSLFDGEELFRVTLPGSSPSIDLGCGDFDGDGRLDSLVGSSSDRGVVYLTVISGKNGYTLGSYILSLGGQYRGLEGGWNSRSVPATSVGDLNGDGADDLAYSDGYASAFAGYTETKSLLRVRDVAHRKDLATIITAPSLREGGYGTSVCSTMLQAQADTAGHLLVIGGLFEPSIPSCDPDAQWGDSGSSTSQYLGVVDAYSGCRLAGFAGIDPDAVSLFESHQQGILGVAGRGAICYLSLSPDLQVTSPEKGATTRPILGVKWDGTADGDFSQVYVDEVRNDMSNDSMAKLYLARGKHEIVVRSVDDWGRIAYSPSDLSTPLTIHVASSPWKPVWLVLSLFALLTVILLISIPRLHCMLRARQRAAKP